MRASHASLMRRFALLLAVLLGCAALPSRADDLPEYRLKAAFLYNFAAFTEWPLDAGDTLNLCLYGSDPFGSEIDPLAGKPVGTRKLALRRVPGIDALKGCQIVFVPAAAHAQLGRVQDALRGQPVLTVAESGDALRQGAVLNMQVVGGRITFQANLAAARAAQLTLSSKLLRLATEVLP